MANADALWLPVLPELSGFGSALTKGVAKEAQGAGKSTGKTFGLALGAAVATVAGVAAAGTALFNVGKTFQDMTNTIRVGTGAAGEDLDGMVDIAKKVGQQVPHEFDEIGNTVADLNTVMGLTGDDLEMVSGQILEAGRMLGEDLDIGTIGQSFNAFGVETEDMSGSLDYLFNVSQATGIGMNDLAEKTRQAAPAADALGFSFEETAGMVGQLDKAGLDSGKMLQNMSRRMGDLAKDGEQPRDTFNRVAGEIQEMVESGDRFGAQDLAGKAFGTRNAEQFIKALEDGTMNLEDLTGAADHSGDTIMGLSEETMTFGEHWQVFKNKILVALEPIAARVFGGMGDLMDGLSEALTDRIIPAFEGFVDWLGRAKTWLIPLGAVIGALVVSIVAVNSAMAIWTTLTTAWKNATLIATGVQKAFNAVMKANPIGLVITAITLLVGALVWFFTKTEIGQKLWSKFTDLMVTAWDWVVDKVGGAATWLWEKALEPFFSWVSDTWTTVWGWISEVWETKGQPVWDALYTAAIWVWDKALEPFFSWIGEAWGKVMSWLGEAWETWGAAAWSAIETAALWLWEHVLEPVFGFIGSYWGLILEAMKLAWEYVLKPAWTAISTIAVWLWEKVLEPVFSFIGDHWHLIIDGMVWVWEHILKPVWDAVAAIAMWLWEKALEPIFRWIGDHWDVIVYGMKLAWEEYLKPAWDRMVEVGTWLWEKLSDIFSWIGDKWSDMKDRISSIYHNYIKPVFDTFGDAVEGLKDRFKTAVDNIKRVWAGVKKAVADPVISVIRVVLNRGLIDGFNNFIADNVPGVSSLDPITVPESLKNASKGYARGGWTGPGAKYDPAGIVHADEFVINKAARRRFEHLHPGLLTHINTHGDMAGYAKGGLVQPVRGRVTSGFGAGRGRYPHAGIDFAVPVGTPVAAALDGTVLRTGFGNVLPGRTGGGVYLGHAGNTQTYYGHLSRMLVKVGEQVAKGQAIALSGNTGNSTGPHLHFETHSGGKPLNPAQFLGGAAIPAGSGDGPGFVDILAPFRALGGKLSASISKLLPDGGMVADLSTGLVKNTVDDIAEWASSKVGQIGDFLTGDRNAGSGPVMDQVKGIASGFGWGSGSQWSALQQIIGKESGGNPRAKNPSSTASGLFQLIAANRTASPWDVPGHTKDGLNYIKGRYGTPSRALAFHKRHNWYADGGLVTKPGHHLFRDQGGNLPPGLSMVLNKTGRDEAILNDRQWQDIHALAARGSGGSGLNVYGDIHTTDIDEMSRKLHEDSRRARAVGLEALL